MVPGWKIVSFSRAQGRGVVACAPIGELPFDASHTDVDELREGDRVAVGLVAVNGVLRVSWLRAEQPRFRIDPSLAEAPLAAALEDSTRERLDALPLRATYRLARFTGKKLVVESSDDAFASRAAEKLVFGKVRLVELPVILHPNQIRLSTAPERALLAQKLRGLAEDELAVTFVPERDRLYFVVARSFSWS